MQCHFTKVCVIHTVCIITVTNVLILYLNVYVLHYLKLPHICAKLYWSHHVHFAPHHVQLCMRGKHFLLTYWMLHENYQYRSVPWRYFLEWSMYFCTQAEIYRYCSFAIFINGTVILSCLEIAHFCYVVTTINVYIYVLVHKNKIIWEIQGQF